MAMRVVDGSDKKNLYTLLCNISDEKDSIIIDAINTERKDLEREKEDTLNFMSNTKNKIEHEKENLRIMNVGLSQAIDFFRLFDSNVDLQKYFSLLDIDANFLDNAKATVEEEQETNNLTGGISSEIERLEKEEIRLETDLDSLEEVIEKNQKISKEVYNITTDLYNLIEGAVNGNGSFNKDYVSGLLIPLEKVANKYNIGFPEGYLEDGAKAIFFPDDEDGLSNSFIDYTNNRNREIVFVEGKDKNTIEPEVEVVPKDNDLDAIVFEEEPVVEDTAETIPVEDLDIAREDVIEEEPKEPIEEKVEPEEEIVDEKEEVPEDGIDKNNVENVIEEIDKELVASSVEEPVEEKVEEPIIEEPAVEEKVEEPVEEKVVEEDVKPNIVVPTPGEDNEIASLYGLDSNRVSKELLSLLGEAKEELVRKNMEELKIMNLDDEFYYVNDGYSYLTDSELSSKFNLLRSKGINDKVLTAAIRAHYLDSSLENITKDIKLIEEKGKFNESFLPLLKYKVSNFFDSMAKLNEYGIEPDEKEQLQYMTLLTVANDNILPDTEVLKDYGISLLRKNGKYELGLYIKNPLELEQSIDDIVETGEEDLVNTIPEVLKENTDYIVKIINYLKDNNIEYKDGDSYSDIVYKPLAFKEAYPNVELESLDSTKNSNANLAELLDNEYCTVLIQILERYYQDFESYKTFDLNESEMAVCDQLKEVFEQEMGASLVGKNTYKINNVYVSRNKFERNLYYLVSGLLSKEQDVMSIAKEVLLVSALFNSRKRVNKPIVLPDGPQEHSMGGKAA